MLDDVTICNLGSIGSLGHIQFAEAFSKPLDKKSVNSLRESLQTFGRKKQRENTVKNKRKYVIAKHVALRLLTFIR